jgi:hypothetical protein
MLQGRLRGRMLTQERWQEAAGISDYERGSEVDDTWPQKHGVP